MVIEFLKVYGVMLALIALIFALAWTLTSCVSKVKRLEKTVFDLRKEILDRMDESNRALYEEQKKERRLLNESMSNLSESVTRAVFSIKAEIKKEE